MAGQDSEQLTDGVPPYFDVLFTRLQEHEPATSTAFGRHVHWGYWGEPAQADGSPEDYARAAEELCRRICDAAGIRNGMRILDVGCGYGGTAASLIERFTNLDIVGVNIDPRQLERARQTVRPQNGNRVRFVEGDACKLDFPPDSFDVVLAVECIFHFPDRQAFLAGASHSLVDGGMLALSDFVPPESAISLLESYNAATDTATRMTYGHINVLATLERYRAMGRSTRLAMVQDQDINEHTLPTYPFLRKHFRTWPDPEMARLFDRATGKLEMACHMGLLAYRILSFRKQPANAERAA